MTEKILYFDTETTGTDASECELVELAFKGDGWDEPLSKLFDTMQPIPPEASAIHNITNKMIEGEPMPSLCSVGLNRNFMPFDFICAHNLPYDYEIMCRYFPWFKDKFPASKCIDTLRMARHLYPDLGSHRMQVLRYAFDLDIDAGLAHRAGADVIVLEAVFCHMYVDYMEDHPQSTLEELVEFIKQPLDVRVVSFGKYRGHLVVEMHQKDPDYCRWLQHQAWFHTEHPDLSHTMSCLDGKLL